MKDIKYWIWLSFFKLKPVEKIIILKAFKYKPKEIWNIKEKTKLYIKLLEYTKENVSDVKITKNRMKIILNEVKNNKEKYSDKLLEKIECDLYNNDIKIITCIDKEYPQILLNTYDYPILLYVKGNKNILNNKMIAMVGGRKYSEYGKKVALKLSFNIANKNISIISGMALGIDTFSHIGCLKANRNYNSSTWKWIQ